MCERKDIGYRLQILLSKTSTLPYFSGFMPGGKGGCHGDSGGPLVVEDLPLLDTLDISQTKVTRANLMDNY